jgi:hypothetical protein
MMRGDFTVKCITVYTNSFELFSDLYPQIVSTPMDENEEKVLEGVTISESGEVPANYLERMKIKPDVAVMKAEGTTILQHGQVFEILLH